MFLYWLLNVQRLPYWFAMRCLAACRAISTAQVVVLGPLLILLLFLPGFLAGSGHGAASSSPSTSVITPEEEAARQHELIEKRWRVKRFYARTIYKPGSFPRKGFNQADGTPWTPEVGGPCYDEQRNRIHPEYHKPQPTRPDPYKHLSTGFSIIEEEEAP